METTNSPSRNQNQVDDARTNPSILVPIRYPLTAESTQTLEYARELIDEEDDVDLQILHINLFQRNDTTKAREIRQAIAPIVGSHDPVVIVRQGFLVEETIYEEALLADVDVIALGGNRRARWRRLLSRILWNDPDIAAYLRTNVDATIEIAE